MSRKQFVDFIESTNLRLMKTNVRKWGSFGLVMVYENVGQFHDGEMFGWGFSTHDAAIATFIRYVTERGVEPQFAQFMGGERLQKLINIVLHPEPEKEPEQYPKLLLPAYDEAPITQGQG